MNSPSSAGEVRVVFEAMAARNEIVVAGVARDVADAAIAAAVAEVRRIEAKYSRYRDDSIVSRINSAAGSQVGVEIDAETSALLDFAGALFVSSDGLFDVTSGALRRAWDFRAARVPSDAELAPLLMRVGWPLVERQTLAVRLARAGMELDFGGIGKEYAADRACAELARAGVAHGFVNLAGDIALVGPRPDGTGWSLGVQHPRDADATCAGVLLARGALATSGDYERFFVTPEGRRCCHILDPRTGQPASRWQSVSVIAPTCAAAGALSTIAMLLGAQALPFLRAQGVSFFAVDAAGRTHARDVAHPFIDTRSSHEALQSS